MKPRHLLVAAAIVVAALTANVIFAGWRFKEAFLAEAPGYQACRSAMSVLRIGDPIDQAKASVQTAADAIPASDTWQSQFLRDEVEKAAEWRVMCDRYVASPRYRANGNDFTERTLAEQLIIGWSRWSFADRFDRLEFEVAFADLKISAIQPSACTVEESSFDTVVDCQLLAPDLSAPTPVVIDQRPPSSASATEMREGESYP